MPESVKIETPKMQSTDIAVVGPNSPISMEEAKAQSEAIARALRRAANRARRPASVISGGSGFRARPGARAFRLGIITSFFVLVAVPLLAASAYWGLLASNQYATEAKFALRAGEAPPVMEKLSGLAGLPASRAAQDAQIVTNYIRSRSMIEALEKELDLRGMFSRGDIDYLSRFDRTDPLEDLEKYWRKRMDSSIDAMSGIISISVRAFTPADSLAIATKVIELSERLVNELSTRSRRDALARTRTELARAEQRLKATTASMRDARDAEGVLDADAAAEAINKIINALRLELAKAEESLIVHANAAAHDAPQVRILNARVQSLKKQIADYAAQIAGDKGGESMAGRLGALSKHQIELDLARQQYELAVAAFEKARVDLETQQAYILPFLRPTLAEKSTYPRRWWEWSIIVVPSILGWALLVGIAFLVRDHMAK